MCTCGRIHTNAARQDPTHTVTLRKRWEQEFGRRFRKLRGRIRKVIVDDDGFGLRTNQRQFAFERSEDKVAAFLDWLRRAQREEVIGVSEGVPINRAGRQAWTHIYVEAAYRSGVQQSANTLKSAGASVSDRWVDAAFNRPIHADRLGLAYTRVFSELEGITDAMDRQISRVLAAGIGRGAAPGDIARAINDRVSKIGMARAKTLARTEVISAHAEASLNSYEEAGVEGVDVLAELATAGDGKVCEECEALERQVEADGGWPLDRARGVVPVHPNCRCAWIPRVVNGTGIELR